MPGQYNPPRKHDVNELGPARAIEMLTTSISDPEHPLHCAECLTGCLILINSNKEYSEDYAYLRSHTTFYDTLVVFLLRPRTDDEVKLLKTKMGCYTCSTGDFHLFRLHEMSRAHHAPTVEKPNATLEVFMSHIIAHLGLMLESASATGPLTRAPGMPKSMPQVRNYRRGHQPLWPRKPSDLVPYGGAASIAAFYCWSETTEFYEFISMVFYFVAECSLEVIPPFVNTPFMMRKIDSKFDDMKKLVSRHEEMLKKMHELPQDLPDELISAMAKKTKKFIYTSNCLTQISLFIMMVSLPTLCARHHQARVFSSWSLRLNIIVDLYQEIIPWLPHLSKRMQDFGRDCDDQQMVHAEIVEGYRRYGGILRNILGLRYDCNIFDEDILNVSLGYRRIYNRNTHSMAFTAFHKFGVSYRCFAPGCTKTYASTGRKIQQVRGMPSCTVLLQRMSDSRMET